MQFRSKLLQRRAAVEVTLKKIYDVYMTPDGRFAASEQGDAAKNPKPKTGGMTASSRVCGKRCLLPKKSSFKLNF